MPLSWTIVAFWVAAIIPARIQAEDLAISRLARRSHRNSVWRQRRGLRRRALFAIAVLGGVLQKGGPQAGIMPAKMVPDWEIPARDLYMEYPQRRRDEAVRTGIFGAAAMIYAARSLGLGSTPTIGFDVEAVAREFALAEDEVPVMLLSVGAERPGNWPQKPRRPVADALALA